MLRRQKPLDDFAHACFYFCAQGTCLAPIHWTSGADRRRVARCGFMSSFGSLYCRSLTWCLALLISRQSLMCGGPRRSRVFSRNERAMQNQTAKRSPFGAAHAAGARRRGDRMRRRCMSGLGQLRSHGSAITDFCNKICHNRTLFKRTLDETAPLH